MVEPRNVDPDRPVDDVMRRWPGAIRVFLDHRMACIGCPIARFHTVEEACSVYGLERGAFLLALDTAMASSGMPAERAE